MVLITNSPHEIGATVELTTVVGMAAEMKKIS
jgi:hypothetical protein